MGEKASNYVFYRPFHKLLIRAGLKGYRRYDMRHTGASWMVQNGCNIFVLQELMGHKNISTTRRYAHLERKQKQEAVDSISDQLGDEDGDPRNSKAA
jgi:site-specific recombinase XerD